MGYCRRAGRFCLVDEMYMAVGACFEHTLEVRECGIPPPGGGLLGACIDYCADGREFV